MDYISQIRQLFHCNLVDIEERMKLVTVQFSVCSCELPLYDELLSLIQAFPQRDKVKFFLKDDSYSSFTITSTNSQSKDEYENFTSSIFEQDTVHITVEIDKQIVDNQFSVYTFSHFCDDLLSLAMTDVMTAFAELYSEADHLFFKVYDENVFCKTGTMAFSSADHTITWGLSNRKDRLEKCREASCFYNQSIYPLLPDDFAFEISFTGNPLEELFEKINTALSLTYLSTNSSIIGSKLRIQITGQRNLDYSVQLTDIKPNKELHKIYHWIFTDGNVVDKALLARNSISFHCRLTGIDNLDEGTFSSIKSNYNLYLRENVAKYIELTNAMASFIQESTNNVSDCITQLLVNLKSNIIAVMSFVFTAVLANIVSGQSLENIFTHDIKIILYIVFAGSVVYYLISVAEVHSKKEKMIKQYNDLTALYKNVLSEGEIAQITNGDKALSSAQTSLKRGVIIWSVIWLGIILLAFIIIDCIGESPHGIKEIITWITFQFSRLISFLKNCISNMG